MNQLDCEMTNGVYKAKRCIASFEPCVCGRRVIRDLRTGKEEIYYKVKVIDHEGNEFPAREYKDVRDIDYFLDFYQDTSDMTNSDMKYIAYKLWREAMCMTEENTTTTIVATPDFYIDKEEAVLVVGNEVFCERESFSGVESTSKHVWSDTIPVNQDTFEKYICFMPGVSEILFYAALSAVLQPILAKMNVVTGFATAVIAPSGHLKTTLVRIFTQWTVSPDSLEILFDDKVSNDKLSEIIHEAAGFCFLIDDYHNKNCEYAQKKYRDRLDYISRLTCSKKACAGVFITAESIEGESIFSGQDRLLEIFIPRMGLELNEYKQKLSTLHSNEMASIAKKFAGCLIKNFTEARGLIEEFINSYQTFEWVDNTTRLGHHQMILKLTEYLFRYFMCGNSEHKSFKLELDRALEVNGKKQNKELIKLRKAEFERPYAVEIYDILKNSFTQDVDSSSGIYISTSKEAYNAEKNGAVYCDRLKDYFYITSNNLGYILVQKLGHTVSIRKISSQLHDLGVLMEDGDKHTVKFKEHRHYVIDFKLLEGVCKRIMS